MINIAVQFMIGGFSRALSWATANATRMLAVALALALAWASIERIGKHKAQKVLASTETALHRQIDAHGTTVLSLQALTRAVKAQTAMVRQWTAISDQRRNAAQLALRAAQERGKGLEATALRIDTGRANRGAGGPVCPTSDAVMAARGQL